MRLPLASLSSLAPLALGSLTTLVALVGPAAAQSGPPGQCACTPPPQAWALPAAPAPEPWEAHRFGLGLRLSGLTLGERASDGAAEQQFSVGGLVARYRASRRIELELAVEHGTEQLEDGYQSDLELSAVTAAMLVHLSPQSVWDWYLLGGLGGNERRFKGADDAFADQRSHLALGVGLERRWDHLVIGVELRALAVSPHDEEDVAVPQPEPYPLPQPVPGATVVVEDEEEASVGGGQLSVSATWFF